MADDGWCLSHRTRLADVGEPRFACEALVVKRALETGQVPPLNRCWACAISETDFRSALTEGALLLEKTKVQGGTYGVPGLAMSIGPGKPEDVS